MKARLKFARTDDAIAIGDLTINKLRLKSLPAVDLRGIYDVGATLENAGMGEYYFDAPLITEEATIDVEVTGDPGRWAEGVFAEGYTAQGVREAMKLAPGDLGAGGTGSIDYLFANLGSLTKEPPRDAFLRAGGLPGIEGALSFVVDPPLPADGSYINVFMRDVFAGISDDQMYDVVLDGTGANRILGLSGWGLSPVAIQYDSDRALCGCMHMNSAYAGGTITITFDATAKMNPGKSWSCRLPACDGDSVCFWFTNRGMIVGYLGGALLDEVAGGGGGGVY